MWSNRAQVVWASVKVSAEPGPSSEPKFGQSGPSLVELGPIWVEPSLLSVDPGPTVRNPIEPDPNLAKPGPSLVDTSLVSADRSADAAQIRSSQAHFCLSRAQVLPIAAQGRSKTSNSGRSEPKPDASRPRYRSLLHTGRVLLSYRWLRALYVRQMFAKALIVRDKSGHKLAQIWTRFGRFVRTAAESRLPEQLMSSFATRGRISPGALGVTTKMRGEVISVNVEQGTSWVERSPSLVGPKLGGAHVWSRRV